MAKIEKPLFVKRPPSRGTGFDPNGIAGWSVTLGFAVIFGATMIGYIALLSSDNWWLGIPAGCVVIAEALGFVWFAMRNAER